jgi:3-hydroxyisobutyrate dehydrogenase-like beta-hydroxyacid dehydrogenase
MTTKIGMIGIGLMGHGIASNLIKHGHSLVLLEHEGNQPLEALIAAGAKTAKTPSALAAQVDMVILVVTGSPQVEAVLLGDEGVLKGMKPGTVVIDCSTAIPTSTDRVAKKVIDAGGLFLDSPMTRTPKEAALGKLNLLVGGDMALFERCKPILQCFAENISHAGSIGAGHRMKLLHNYVALGTIAVLAEADLATFVEVLGKGGGAGVALERIKPFLLNGDPSNLQFSISNALKDLGYYNTMAVDSGADRSIAEAIKRTLEIAVQDGNGQKLVPQLASVIAARSKVVIRP